MKKKDLTAISVKKKCTRKSKLIKHSCNKTITSVNRKSLEDQLLLQTYEFKEQNKERVYTSACKCANENECMMIRRIHHISFIWIKIHYTLKL